MKKLLTKLDKLWSNADERLRGENPACDRVLVNIKAKLEGMTDEELVEQLESLTLLQLEQILPALEEMSADNPRVDVFIGKVMN